MATQLLINKNIMNETIRSNKKYKNLLGHEKAEKIMFNYNKESDMFTGYHYGCSNVIV